jgi:tetratricopeptide (TPR) repeat protein
MFCGLVRGISDRVAGLAGLPENQEFSKAVRTAHIQALERLVSNYRAIGRPEWESHPHTRPDVFFERSREFCRTTIGRCLNPKVKLNIEVTGALGSAIDAILFEPVRDGPAGKRAEAIAFFAEQTVLNELVEVLDGVILPDGFEDHFRKGAGGRPRFLDLFGAYVAEQIKGNERFRAILTAGLLSRIEALAFDSTELLARIELRFRGVLAQIAKTTEEIRATQEAHGVMLAEVLALSRKEHATHLEDETRQPQPPTKANLPPPIASLVSEGCQLVGEGRYAEAIEAFLLAARTAEADGQVSALLEARIRIAEAKLFAQRDVVATRDSLLTYLRELSSDSHPDKRQRILGLLGDAEVLLGNVGEAKSLYSEARQLAEKRGDSSSEAHHLIGLSHAEELLGNLHDAHRLLDEATDLIRVEHRAATGEERGDTAINLGVVFSTKARLLRHEGKVTDAIGFLTRAEAIFREAKSRDNLGRTLLLKGELLQREAKRDESFNAMRGALEGFESIGNVVWQCRCLDAMATFLFEQGHEMAASSCVARALQLIGAERSVRESVPFLLKFAFLLREHDRFDDARKIVHQAQKTAATTDDDWLIAQCLVAEATNHEGTDGDTAGTALITAAVTHIESAISKCEVKGRRAEYMRKIGDLCGWLGNHLEARRWFEQSLREHEQIGDVVGMGNALASIAAVSREHDSAADSITVLERLIAFCEGRPLHYQRAGALHDLGMLRLSQGDVEGARRCIDTARALAEKHQFRSILDVLKHSLERLDDAECLHQPPKHDFPSLIQELHEWSTCYPRMRGAILPLWYYIHRTELWSILRSKLGVKFLICTKSLATYRRIANAMRGQADCFVWGINFSIKAKRRTELIPWPDSVLIPTDRTNQTRAQSRAVMEARRAGASRRAFHAWQQASAMAS